MTNARDLSNRLAELLRREHHAMADFLLALAEFDRLRAWEQLGYGSLFAFLHRELGLSKGSAYYRKVAAELLQRFPEVVAPLRDGRLCVTSVIELAKVLTPENRDDVLPRFFHRSKQEAKAITAELQPQHAPRRDVVTTVRVGTTAPREPANEVAPTADSRFALAPARGGDDRAGADGDVTASHATATAAAPVQPVEPARANSVVPSWAAPSASPRTAPRDVADPLTGELSRLHITVSRRFLAKLDAARDALSHARPGATSEELLEAALDLLLRHHAKRKAAAVKRPRAATPTPSSAAEAGAPLPTNRNAAEPTSRHVPAAVRREVWARDQGRCQWPLEAGGICGSTHRLELDHVTPVALGGASTVGNLRVLCERHNKLAARRTLGDGVMDHFARRGTTRPKNERALREAPLPFACGGA